MDMKRGLAEKWARRAAKWFTARLGVMPPANPESLAWPARAGTPARARRRLPYRGRDPEGKVPKRVEKFHFRGARLRREFKGKHSRKAVLHYRGKGYKVERRAKWR